MVNNKIYQFSSAAIIFCFLLCFVGVPALRAEEPPAVPVSAVASVDRETVAIGDAIRYSVVVEATKDVLIEFPDFGENLGGFAIKDFGEKSEESFWRNKKRIEKWFLLDTYVSGEYEIPQMIVTYKNEGDDLSEEVETEALEVTVESVLAMMDGQDDIYDIKQPVNFPSQLWLLVWILLGVLFLAGAGFASYAFVKRHNGEPIIPLKPAHEIAYGALRELKLKKYVDKGLVKDFYSELSLIIRHYVENRFEIRAPEMTTEEFLGTVRTSEGLQGDHKTLLRDFLEQSDMVKFAKYGPLPEEIAKSFESAHHFIDETRADSVEDTKDEYDL